MNRRPLPPSTPLPPGWQGMTREQLEALTAHYRREAHYHLTCARLSRVGFWTAIAAAAPLLVGYFVHSAPLFGASCLLVAVSATQALVVRWLEWRHDRKAARRA